MKSITKTEILVIISLIFSISSCTSFVSINRHNNGSCQHLDYSTTNEVKNDSTQVTIKR